MKGPTNGLCRTTAEALTKDESSNPDHLSQASEVGSIPIARSINPDDSVDLTRLSYLNSTKKRLVLDGSWTVIDSIGRSITKRLFAAIGKSLCHFLCARWPDL
jgi:hypothetical protein